ncbi:hypothetical protein JYK00_09565 [Thermosipho ferrireducens]|uniref:Zinc/iron-chelating domain-containing protein n=1 Tax=Thermosipho ferrireducens TaxID=2571116 RepID=A0ABX7S5V2_9BACT|nr:hypothetical protein [Thermosipho ferrireducens]QTA37947.1 hypothetical protein JYK00_09565 [Thermosipho ferrireducens]
MDWEKIIEEFSSESAHCPECLKCGYCCKHTPCFYGEWDSEKQRCRYLTENNLCGKYKEIVALEEKMGLREKMFGSGCCLNYMNPDRLKLLREVENKER